MPNKMNICHSCSLISQPLNTCGKLKPTAIAQQFKIKARLSSETISDDSFKYPPFIQNNVDTTSCTGEYLPITQQNCMQNNTVLQNFTEGTLMEKLPETKDLYALDSVEGALGTVRLAECIRG